MAHGQQRAGIGHQLSPHAHPFGRGRCRPPATNDAQQYHQRPLHAGRPHRTRPERDDREQPLLHAPARTRRRIAERTFASIPHRTQQGGPTVKRRRQRAKQNGAPQRHRQLRARRHRYL